MIAEQRDGDGVYIRFTDGTEWSITTAAFNALVVSHAGDRDAAVAELRADVQAIAPEGFDASRFSVTFRPGGGVDLEWSE